MYRSNRAFLGRRQEFTELTNTLDDAMSGTSRLVMLVGEPEVGKTRAAQEGASISEKRGAQTL
jgi:Cdc6-like AAA superfamily ATPase